MAKIWYYLHATGQFLLKFSFMLTAVLALFAAASAQMLLLVPLC